MTIWVNDDSRTHDYQHEYTVAQIKMTSNSVGKIPCIKPNVENACCHWIWIVQVFRTTFKIFREKLRNPTKLMEFIRRSLYEGIGIVCGICTHADGFREVIYTPLPLLQEFLDNRQKYVVLTTSSVVFVVSRRQEEWRVLKVRQKSICRATTNCVGIFLFWICRFSL